MRDDDNQSSGSTTTPARAHCTLSAFLDQPDSPPPADWVDAVSRPGAADTAELVERAEVARERAEEMERRVAEISTTSMSPSSADRAIGMLVATFNVEPGRAFECLAWVAQETGTELSAVADRFLARVAELGESARGRETLLRLLGELVGADPEPGTD